MEILFFCTRWGYEHLPWEEFCQKVSLAGYDGVETSLTLDTNETNDILSALNKYGLKLIGQHWDTVTANFDTHVAEYDSRLRSMAAASPLFITSHTGKDFFTVAQNEHLLNLANQISLDTGVSIVHETHRGKFSFAAHVTKPYLERLTNLQLTLDISHWFNVAESYLEDQQEAVELAIARTAHLHARVGYTNGPQVTDPRAPEWQAAVNQHLTHWDKVIAQQKNKGSNQFTITTEFGPYPYLQYKPYTHTPVASQWDINLYMKAFLISRYL